MEAGKRMPVPAVGAGTVPVAPPKFVPISLAESVARIEDYLDGGETNVNDRSSTKTGDAAYPIYTCVGVLEQADGAV